MAEGAAAVRGQFLQRFRHATALEVRELPDTPHPELRGVVALSLLQPASLTTVRPFARPCTKSSKAPGSASKSMVRVIAARWRGFRSVASRSQTRRRFGKGM